MYGDQALKLLCSPEYAHHVRVLDVGSGAGEQAEVFRASGKTVFEVDLDRNGISPMAFRTHIEDFDLCDSGVDIIWCSHCLEHLHNVHLVLGLFRDWLCEDGALAITVPPMKHSIVGGHMTVWNAGLLLYNLVVAGFDCRRARIKKYGYNISVIVGKDSSLIVPALHHDSGDIALLAHLFPPELGVHQGFEGDIEELNWEHGRS
jgi:SAM-dependent methyltransferase